MTTQYYATDLLRNAQILNAALVSWSLATIYKNLWQMSNSFLMHIQQCLSTEENTFTISQYNRVQ